MGTPRLRSRKGSVGSNRRMPLDRRNLYMKIFISWSGTRSHKVAELLSSWLKCVLQASKPWISSDMDRGIVWFNAVNEALADTSTGIVCLTAENLNAPWILFEAGSLSHGLTDKRVLTFLIDITSTDVEAPLSQFNHTLPERGSLFSLVKTINGRLGDDKLDSDTLSAVFNTYYPQFKKQFEEIISETEASEGDPKESTKRSEQNILEEVLVTVRNLNQRVAWIEGSPVTDHMVQVGKPYFGDKTSRHYNENISIIRNYLTESEIKEIHDEFFEMLARAAQEGIDSGAVNHIASNVAKRYGVPYSYAKNIIFKLIKKERELIGLTE